MQIYNYSRYYTDLLFCLQTNFARLQKQIAKKYTAIQFCYIQALKTTQMKQILHKTGWLVLLLNMAVLCHFILLKNEPGTFRVQQHSNNKRQSGINTIPFASVKKIYYSNKSTTYKFKNIAGNIIGFMPLGFLLPFLAFRRFGFILSIITVCLISCGFEYIQLYTGCGVFDIDDIILNSLGGTIGALAWGVWRLIQYVIPKRKKTTLAIRTFRYCPHKDNVMPTLGGNSCQYTKLL